MVLSMCLSIYLKRVQISDIACVTPYITTGNAHLAKQPPLTSAAQEEAGVGEADYNNCSWRKAKGIRVQSLNRLRSERTYESTLSIWHNDSLRAIF